MKLNIRLPIHDWGRIASEGVMHGATRTPLLSVQSPAHKRRSGGSCQHLALPLSDSEFNNICFACR